jgi:phospholipase/carboxylesterase
MHQTTDIILPQDNTRAILIWCHGLGASPSDFADLAHCLPKSHTAGLSIILPAAALRPISCNFNMIMPGWYDIPNLTTLLPEDETGIIQSCQQINQLIQQQKQQHPSVPIYLGGFSQGGALSLYYGTRHPSDIQGIICASGYLPLHQTCPPAVNAPPILLLHGSQDPVIPFDLYQKTHDTLLAKSYTIATHTEAIEHTITLNGMQIIDAWLKNKINRDQKQ